ncbi:MAG: trimethylamine methyltransferase family protein [Deltaproteobacteria bacterium]|nr:trimethylamine methyltransferase family protein [Deltaproteobacteria bacterium]
MALLPRLKILSENDLQRVHDASIKILESIGVVFESDEAIEIFKKHGVKVEGKKVFIPKKQAEAAMAQAPEVFKYRARHDQNTIICGEGFAPHPNIGPVFCQDMDKGRRPGTIRDFINFQKLSQASEYIKVTGATPVAPQDIFPVSARSLHMLYQSIKHTDKPLVGSCDEKRKVELQLDMVETSMGQKGFLENNCCIGVSCNPLSPLAYGTETIETMLAYARRRQPVFLLPCIMAGATGPMSLLGTIIQQNAEILAGASLIHLQSPGNPIVYCPASTAADMRTANVAYSAPEQFLINIPGLQMAIDFYRLPTRILTGMTSSKREDVQAGYESMMNLLLGMLGGGHLLLQCFGVLDSIMTTSYEKFVIDEEFYSKVLRFCQGLDTSDENYTIEILNEVGSKGSFLTHPDTMKKFRNHWLPIHGLASWETYNVWEKHGGQDIMVRANRKWKEILAKSPETLIDQELDRELLAILDRAND